MVCVCARACARPACSRADRRTGNLGNSLACRPSVCKACLGSRALAGARVFLPFSAQAALVGGGDWRELGLRRGCLLVWEGPAAV